MNSQTTCEATIVIVSFNTRERLAACLRSIHEAIGDRPIDVAVVDNASRDDSASMVASDFPTVKLYRSDTNLGFAAANNLAFRDAEGEFLILVNPDAVVSGDSIDRALAHLRATPEAAAGGARLVDEDGRDAPSARRFPSLLDEALVLSGLAARFPRSRFFGRFDRTWADPAEAAPVDWVPGAFTIFRREPVIALGGFDERFFLYYEEVDLCRRLRGEGWSIWYWPDIVVHHVGGESSRTVESETLSSSGAQLVLWRMRSALLYYRKHHGGPGAFCLAALERGWHRLRALRARLRGQQGKARESGELVALMQRAWSETRGGLESPPRPW